MFSFYLHVLRKNGVVKNRFLTIATISLFLLCTVYCALLLATTEIANVINGSAELSRQSLQIYVSLNRVEHDLRDQQVRMYVALGLEPSPVQSQMGFRLAYSQAFNFPDP
jgi:hypothetical protein